MALVQIGCIPFTKPWENGRQFTLLGAWTHPKAPLTWWFSQNKKGWIDSKLSIMGPDLAESTPGPTFWAIVGTPPLVAHGADSNYHGTVDLGPGWSGVLLCVPLVAF